MQLVGRIFEDKDGWVAEVPLIDVYTQGDSREDAATMLADAIESLVNRKGFRVTVTGWVGDQVLVGASDLGAFLPFVLRKCRESGGTSLSEAAAALGQTSKTAIARYEQGESMPTLEKLTELLSAFSSEVRLLLVDTAVPKEGVIPLMETLKESLRRAPGSRAAKRSPRREKSPEQPVVPRKKRKVASVHGRPVRA